MPCCCSVLICSFCIKKARKNLHRKMEEDGFVNILDSDEEGGQESGAFYEETEPYFTVSIDLTSEETDLDDGFKDGFKNGFVLDHDAFIESVRKTLDITSSKTPFGPERIPMESLCRLAKKKNQKNKTKRSKRSFR